MQRSSRVVTLLALSALAAVSTACQSVGNRLTTNGTSADVRTGTPNTLTLTDPEGQWTSNSVGPAQWTDMTAEGVQTFRQGSTPREVFWQNKEGERLVISSGSDIRATGVVVDPSAGMISIGEFSTSSSEPIRAGNEAYDRLVTWWQSLTQAQRDAHLADVQAWQEAGNAFAPVLLQVLRSIAGAA